MVSEWAMASVASVWAWFIAGIPAPDAPTWFHDAEAGIATAAPFFAWLGPWAPTGLLVLVLGVWAVTWVLGNAIQIGMKILSYFTLGGGAT